MGCANDAAFFVFAGDQLYEARHGGRERPSRGGCENAKDVDASKGVRGQGEAERADGDERCGDEDGSPAPNAVTKPTGEDLKTGRNGQADGRVIRGCGAAARNAKDEQGQEQGDGAPIAGGQVANAEQKAYVETAEQLYECGQVATIVGRFWRGNRGEDQNDSSG